MPDPRKMIIVRPRSCHYCGNGYYALGHVVDYARDRGFNVTDLSDDYANKQPIWDAINTTDAQYFFGFGHGSETTYTGDAEQPIFTTTDDLSLLSQRQVYLFSCLTANFLGTAIVQAGASYYAGYNISWTWEVQGSTDDDPYLDYYGRCFWMSGNELWVALCDGKSFPDAYAQCIKKYNYWIDWWYASDDPRAMEIIGWLLHDRDGLNMMSPSSPYPQQPDGQPMTTDAGILIPLAILGGLGALYFLTKGKSKSTRRKH